MAGKRTAWVIVALALVGGCAKKNPPAAAAAEASKKYLPPDAQAYAEIRVPELLGSSAFRPQVDKLLGGLPGECRTLLEATQELSVAAYGSFDDLLALFSSPREKGDEPEGGAAEPPAGPDVAWLLVGPTKAQVLACLEAASHGRAEPREETRGETAVTFLDTPLGSLAMVSPEETTQAVASLGRLDALLAAMGGGPTMDGSPLLAGLAAVPAGSFIGVANVPDELASLVGGLMSKLGGGSEVPLPRTIALSFTVGSDISLTGSMTMADEESARKLESLTNMAVAGMRMMIKAFGDQEPEAKKLGPVMDSISISRSGASVSGSVRIGGELLGEMMSRDRPDGREP